MVFRLPKETEMTLELLAEYMAKHKADISNRYKKLMDAYNSDYAILHREAKPKWKPDNRIVVNFAKYITDTMNGFFMGVPVKTTTDDESVAKYVEYLEKYNNQDDKNSEISKLCDIFGRSYEMYYTDEDAELCTAYLSPMDAFMIYDDSIIGRPLFFVRHYLDKDNNEFGSVSDGINVRYFKATGGYSWTSEPKPHYFSGVPATEYVENGEQVGIFEPEMTIIDAYNKAISEKANDVDYFADAYLKILGASIDGDDLQFIRDNRVVNFTGDDADKLIAEFMDKPDGDTTQENLLNRLERLIFNISMVADINDDTFGTSSGEALKYKLFCMGSLAKTKQRKFEAAMTRRYKLLFSHPSSKVPADSYIGLNYQFTQNYPANIASEAEVARNLEGVVSKETQLKALSIVDNVKQEIERIEQENKTDETIVDKAMFQNTETNPDEVGGQKSKVNS